MSIESFVGTWKLVSYEYHKGDEISYPFGKDAVGYITYNSNGFMSVFLAQKDRKKIEATDMRARVCVGR
jgi:hypothetical protein